MKHEKIIRRENGLKIKLTASFSCEIWNNDHRYSVHVEVCEKRKRLYRPPIDDEAPTKEELHKAKLELWEIMKPVEI